MSRTQKSIAATVLILIAVAVLLWSVFGRGNPSQPTEKVSPGSSPAARTPDDPR